jgi:hypothetical protein
MQRARTGLRAGALLALALLLGSHTPGRAGDEEGAATWVGTPRFQAPNGCHDFDLLGTSARGLVPRVLPITRLCPFEPSPDCRGEAVPGRSKVAFKNHPAKTRKDTVKWSLKKGQQTLPADFGDPTAGTDYELCVYLAFQDLCWLILHPDALAGDGWVARRNGFKFKMRGTSHAEGLRKARLRWGSDRKARIQVKGKGELLGLDLPPFPADAEILVQLHNSAGQCWSTEFGEDPGRSTTRKWKDRSDP